MEMVDQLKRKLQELEDQLVIERAKRQATEAQGG